MKVTGTGGKEYTIKPDANLRDTNLSKASLEGPDLADAYLDEANLMDTNLSKANLEWASLSGASLYRAYLIRADLSDVCLSGADLTNANLSDAVWNDGTVFPEGFESPDELRG